MSILIAYYSRAGENYFGGAYRRISAGNTEKAAEILDMSRATFYRRCRKYGISPRSLAKEYNRARIRQEE